MFLKFGKGKIAVTTVSQDGEGTPANILLIEPGKGTGEIGGIPESRKKGIEVDIEELDNIPGNILMKFNNPESVQIVIGALEVIKKDLSTIG